MSRWIPALFFLMLIVCGCQQVQDQGGVVRKEKIRTAVSLSPSTTELLMISAANVQVIGRTSACNWPKEVQQITVVGDTKPNYEKIAKLNPDIIVYDETVYNDADIQKLQSLNIKLLPMNVHTIDEFIKFLQKLGAVTANETGFNDTIEKIFERKRQNEATAPSPRPKIVTLIGEPATEYMAAGKTSFQAELVRSSGGEALGPESDKFERVSVEALVGWNPDMIVTTSSATDILKDPRLASTSAVKSGKVIEITEADSFLRAGARVEKMLLQLGNVIREIANK